MLYKKNQCITNRKKKISMFKCQPPVRNGKTTFNPLNVKLTLNQSTFLRCILTSKKVL